MRTLAMILTIPLAACAAAAPTSTANVSGGKCVPHAADRFIGKPATDSVGEQMRTAAGARTLRWVHPGEMVSMIFDAERLTVFIGPDKKVASASCS